MKYYNAELKKVFDAEAALLSALMKEERNDVMKYYSTELKKLFDTEAALLSAEAAAKKLELEKAEAEKIKKAKRAERAKEVDAALKAATEARNKALKLLNEFTKDYGYYHTSYTLEDINNDITNKNDVNTVSNFINLLNTFLK